MTRWAAIAIVALGCSACSSAPVRIESRALPNPSSESPERFIIAAVDNGSAAFFAGPGSTPRGYDTITAYGPSSRARELMRSLEEDYGLREVSAWPIEPLHLHCAVLLVPEGTDRAKLLASLAHDRRIMLAEPLQTFATRTDYNDPYVALQRGFQEMHVADAHPWSRGDGVKVAIIDTGVDVGHPDLRAASRLRRTSSTRMRASFGTTATAPKLQASSPPSPTITKASSESRPDRVCSYSRLAGRSAMTRMAHDAIPLPSPRHWLPLWMLMPRWSI